MSQDTLDLFAPPPPPKPHTTSQDSGSEDRLALDLYAERAYLSYAMSVVKSRALPAVEDGLKPVQRRILFAMNEMRLGASAKHVKSARVVGDVIGKYHPHGDSSVYDAMVRVAQDFSLRYPLVDGQGNFGSRDGDSAAAMRYTECRLTPIAELLLSEIDRGTVDFVPNYDGAFHEPQLLPARLPFALLNGATGIAVGMATEIPPHNLTEVANAAKYLIGNPSATIDDVLTHLPGPDFPGAGQIISTASDIRNVYAAGRGSLRMRARWHSEELARGQWRLVITELPHGVSSAQVLAEIETITNPQARAGKREISQEQKTLKQLVLNVLDAARDESSEKEPVRLVLEPRSSRLEKNELMAVLMAHTSLETNVPINLTMIGRDGRPQQKNLVQIIAEWVDFRFSTVERRCRHRLSEVERRIHILEGRMIAFLRIDEVIRCIRESDDPKSDLIRNFALTDIQAEDILEIRLRQLARLEGFKIERELAELRDEKIRLDHLLSHRDVLTGIVLEEIEHDTEKYGDARRTLIEVVAPVAMTELVAPDEPVTVILSRNGWARVRQGHGIDPESVNYKAGDFSFLFAETRTTWPLLLIDSSGRAYSLKVSDLPGGRGDGTPISTMIELPRGARLAQAFTGPLDSHWLFSNSRGYGFIAKASDLLCRQKSGKAFMSVDAGESILPPSPAEYAWVAAATSSGNLLIFPKEEMKNQSAGRGTLMVKLTSEEEMAAAAVFRGGSLTIRGVGRGKKEMDWNGKGSALEKYKSHRGKEGLPLPNKIKAERISGN